MDYIIWILLGIALFILFIAIALNKTVVQTIQLRQIIAHTNKKENPILYLLKLTMSQSFQHMLVREWSNDLEYTLPNRKK